MELDWNRCIICQQDASEPFKCPMQSPGVSYDKMVDVYESFLSNVREFQDINALPTNINDQSDNNH